MLVDLSGFLHGDEAAHSISLELDENAMPNKYEYPVKYPIILKVDIYKVDGEYLINVPSQRRSPRRTGIPADCPWSRWW